MPGHERRPLLRRESTTPRYHSLPVAPPSARPSSARSSFSSLQAPRLLFKRTFSRDRHPPSDSTTTTNTSSSSSSRASPLPYAQLAILALLSLSEQTALNSMGPYLPLMMASFPDVPPDQVSLYIGLLASAFALAQLSSNFLWGFLSDCIGRKPVLMLGSFFLALSCIGFGFSRSFQHAVACQIAMGLLNGNAAIFPTVLGDLTDRSNQSAAFTWLPLVYSIGSVTGPAMGGLFVGKLSTTHPYAAPNIVSAVLLAITIVAMALGFSEPETNQDKRKSSLWECLPDSLQRILKHWWHDSEEAQRPRIYVRDSLSGSVSLFHDSANDPNPFFQRTTVLLLASYFVFQLCNVAFGTLYPVFAASGTPAGRDLDPATIGLLMSLAGVVTMAFQAFLFQSIKAQYGNIGTYRLALAGMVASLGLMPFVGYLDKDVPEMAWRNVLTYGEIGAVLLMRNINNSCPDGHNLGALNGLAQSLSAAGRSLGPVVAGSVFSLAVSHTQHGAVIAWCLFATVAVAGWLGTLVIHCPELESEDYIESHQESPADSPTTEA
ncbi:hypothetical protein TD95_004248 [Thielaviopsis punctulata]|uniref:Major facilitator superfamily (MFS) profile domain-containing protein n=1 Tax=Thielaviopsis punctulata TaxID=72032 RepID=A0A0F4Z7H0_9PEZI|nr:hypothetical protein TD95_004248 [Thielaviopsis punctulata]